ncbi:DUF1656 domain-containing protein [Bisbaumannia pacifica]|uniref:DUF1656 domain-containing protein n=1 Tax=Bisbaumannia pacifica TaxID=77098 RepID=A0ABD4KZR9_9GAMM|nr:DUF1656 domain-containing protein [Halomonas pacifica]MBH8579823.1 DUF1656 domain-containing protein [Halomonas pacifica]
MELKEFAFGGLYIAPLLLYALLGALATLALRWGLHRLLPGRRLWFEAWFDASLFLLSTAAIAFLAIGPGSL